MACAVVFATGAASAVVQILLVIIISLYLMLDSERIHGAILVAVPPETGPYDKTVLERESSPSARQILLMVDRLIRAGDNK